jgi:hypothetical protein
LEKLVKSLHAGFRPFEPLCSVRPARRRHGGGTAAAVESSLRQKSIESVARFQLLTAPPQHIPTSKGGLFSKDIFNLVLCILKKMNKITILTLSLYVGKLRIHFVHFFFEKLKIHSEIKPPLKPTSQTMYLCLACI